MTSLYAQLRRLSEVDQFRLTWWSVESLGRRSAAAIAAGESCSKAFIAESSEEQKVNWRGERERLWKRVY